MKTIAADINQMAMCGLYCGSCKSYLKSKCPGCEKNEKAGWCNIRKCCMGKKIKSCADCDEFSDVKECKIYHNAFARMFAAIFRADRPACVQMIKDQGYDNYVKHMAEQKLVCLKKK